VPYPNEHACRLRDPDQFQKGSFRRIVKGGVSIIIGKLKGKTTTTAQAFRYPKSKWTVERARAHCKRHGGKFEAAAGAQAFTDRELVDLYSDPVNNPLFEVDGSEMEVEV